MNTANALLLAGYDDAFLVGRKEGAGDRITAIVIGHDEHGAAARKTLRITRIMRDVRR